jgi:transposase-like protein
MVEPKTIRRYSIAFQQKVVSEIEAGTLSVAEAQRLYDIRGAMTISTWLRRQNKNHLLARVVKVQMADETSRVKQLEKEKQRLESALAQAHLKILTLESTLDVLERKTGVSVKKKTDASLSKPPSGDKAEGNGASQ